MKIRPVTDLRNHFPEVESEVNETGEVYLTKNGYGTAVLIGLDRYEELKGAAALPPDPVPESDVSYRGVFHKYADPEKISHENEAPAQYAVEKYKRFLKEAGIDE